MAHSQTLSEGAAGGAAQAEPSVALYSAAYLAVAVLIAALLWTLDVLIGLQMPGLATSLVAPVIAALVTGQRWAARRGTVPEPVEAWRFAVKAAAAVLVLNLAVSLAIATAAGALYPAPGIAVELLAGAVALFAGVLLLVNRFFLTYGAASQLRSAR